MSAPSFGRPSDPDRDKAQNGEWLCVDCVEPRIAELDRGIAALKKALEED